MDTCKVETAETVKKMEKAKGREKEKGLGKNPAINDASAEAAPAAPKIEFPCSYPIKIIGRAEPDFQSEVLAAVSRHAGAIDDEFIQVRPSKHRNYLSITVTIMATGEDQLRRLFTDLKALDSVKLVL